MGRFCFLEQCSTISSLDTAEGGKATLSQRSVNEKDGVDAMEVKDLRIV
jgi:hypothetical protein